MYAIAFIADLFSIVPVLNIVTDIIAAGLLFMIGEAEGINIFSSDNIGGTLATMLVEAIPGLSIIPAWTIRVYFAKQAAKNAQ